jgi:hypothetical protein
MPTFHSDDGIAIRVYAFCRGFGRRSMIQRNVEKVRAPKEKDEPPRPEVLAGDNPQPYIDAHLW